MALSAIASAALILRRVVLPAIPPLQRRLGLPAVPPRRALTGLWLVVRGFSCTFGALLLAHVLYEAACAPEITPDPNCTLRTP